MSASVTAEIAASAARLVVEEGLEYAAAKRKAARALDRHGLTARTLPSNEEVEDEVRTHLSLFCADTQPAELLALRQLALRWMQRLAEFRPHLAGAVWRGTATRLSPVLIELYCDDAKAAEIALINLGVDYDSAQRSDARRGDHDVLVVSERSAALGDWVTLHLAVLDHDDLRGALKPDARGRRWRGDEAALRTLLAADGEAAACR
jgi:hypothetical protein